MSSENKLKNQVERQARRIQKADKERPTLIAQTVYAGMLGLLFVLPVIGGAYLGNWIDNQVSGYSVRWTTSLIILGVMIGGMNVYLYIKE
jgi:ATP synthase protein I